MPLRALFPTILLLLMLTACTGSVVDDQNDIGTDEPPSPTLSSIAATPALQALVNGLEEEGYFVTIRNEETRPQGVFPSTSYYELTINEQPVQVYEYIDNESAQNDANLISTDGTSINGQPVRWTGQPHFYHKDNVIALYLGNNPAIFEALEEQLGAQFAGSPIDEFPEEEMPL